MQLDLFESWAPTTTKSGKDKAPTTTKPGKNKAPTTTKPGKNKAPNTIKRNRARNPKTKKELATVLGLEQFVDGENINVQKMRNAWDVDGIKWFFGYMVRDLDHYKEFRKNYTKEVATCREVLKLNYFEASEIGDLEKFLWDIQSYFRKETIKKDEYIKAVFKKNIDALARVGQRADIEKFLRGIQTYFIQHSITFDNAKKDQYIQQLFDTKKNTHAQFWQKIYIEEVLRRIEEYFIKRSFVFNNDKKNEYIKAIFEENIDALGSVGEKIDKTSRATLMMSLYPSFTRSRQQPIEERKIRYNRLFFQHQLEHKKIYYPDGRKGDIVDITDMTEADFLFDNLKSGS